MHQVLPPCDRLCVRPSLQGQHENEYKAFLAELGGGPPPPTHGGQPLRPGLGSVPSGGPTRGRPGDELPDDCKLYVGNLASSVNDDTLKVGAGLFHSPVLVLAVHVNMQQDTESCGP